MNIILKKPEVIHHKQIIKLLQVISSYYPDESEMKFIWQSFINRKDIYPIIAIDTNIDQINNVVGFGSLHLTKKVRGGQIGFIEDIVIKEDYKGKGLGSIILKDLIIKAKKDGCYKLVLECKEETKTFYEKIGFNHSGNSMSILI